MEPIVDPDAKILVVGEMPSAFDDRKGSYQTDRAIRLFSGWLGVPYHYTTVVRCAGEPPKGDELKACRAYLDHTIEDLKPEVILLLGSSAVKAVLKKKVTEVHGQVLEYKGIPTHALFHPAMALRDPSRIDALERAVKRVISPIEEKPFYFTIIRTLDKWNEFIDDFVEADVFAYDTETTGLDWMADGAAINSLQIATDKHTWVLPLAIRDTPWVRGQREEFVETIVRLSAGKTAVAQNGKFDNHWMMADYGRMFHLSFDTQLASHALDENRPHSLKPLSVDLLGADGYDIPLKDKLGLGDLEKFYKYAGKDAFYTLQLYYLFVGQLRKDPPIRKLFYKLIMPAARMCRDAEETGWLIDTVLQRKTRKRLKSRLYLLEDRLNELAGREVNWNSPAQISDVLFKELGLEPTELTDGGAPSTGESALNQLKHPVAEVLKEYRGVNKNLNTYIDGWVPLMHGDRLYLSTKLHGTVTGRWSSRLHQVPRDADIRGHFIAPEGWELVVFDYSQIELRLVAHESQDPRMLMAYHTGEDLHSLTATYATGIPKDQLTKEQRKLAKAINFGFIYGMQWKKFGAYSRDNYGIEVTDQEAKDFRTRFFDLFNTLPAWHERQRKRVRQLGYVTNLAGRRRNLPTIFSTDPKIVGEAERQSINAPIQGFGSGDLKTMAMVEVWEECPRDIVQVKGEVHDSVLTWMRKDCLEEYIPIVKGIMEAPRRFTDFRIKLTVPLVVDAEVGRWGWGEKW
jgi:DNA polymerase-1